MVVTSTGFGAGETGPKLWLSRLLPAVCRGQLLDPLWLVLLPCKSMPLVTALQHVVRRVEIIIVRSSPLYLAQDTHQYMKLLGVQVVLNSVDKIWYLVPLFK